MENTQSQKVQLEIEVDKLRRSLESLKSSPGKIVDLETERDQLLIQMNQLNQQLESFKADRGKFDQLELDLLSANTEKQKTKRALEVIQRKLEDSEREKGEVEAENTKVYTLLAHNFKFWVNIFNRSSLPCKILFYVTLYILLYKRLLSLNIF